ncbi:MAG: hypothetical protein M1500_03915 [Candidatus Marsarchaeota archaeon]|jgi:hypothetical protein|nr:hypothetical protein [Candidatus Marsarchaeota archaeon]MCL5112821.1 hypothetical protein [Candidatus Marsarchaeota archaeon]
MPIKYNLTTYDMLANKIHKLSVKNSSAISPAKYDGESGVTVEDGNIILAKAVIIASFSSNLSWQTYNAIITDPSRLNVPEIRREYEEAASEKWKRVTNNDVREVATKGISDNAFSTWLFYNVDKSAHETYKKAWKLFKSEFSEGCETVRPFI